jgi:hypothetical protein
MPLQKIQQNTKEDREEIRGWSKAIRHTEMSFLHNVYEMGMINPPSSIITLHKFC